MTPGRWARAISHKVTELLFAAIEGNQGWYRRRMEGLMAGLFPLFKEGFILYSCGRFY